MITVKLILLILALVCFIGSALGVQVPRINLQSSGLALWVLSLMVA